jgi:hypothetical protein
MTDAIGVVRDKDWINQSPAVRTLAPLGAASA